MSNVDSQPDSASIRRVSLDVGSYRFDAIEAGPKTGPLVLLLHGWPEFADMWTAVVRALGADGRYAVAVDQRGYSPGARPPAVGDYAIPELVGDVFAFADALGAKQFDVIGHDWGGIVAWAAAGFAPARVRSLTVFATPHPGALAEARANDPDQRQKLAYIGLHVAPDHKAEGVYLADDGAKLRAVYGGKVPAASIDSNVRRLSEPGALTASLNWYRASSLGEVPEISVPTVFIWGSEDIALGERAALNTKNFVRGPYRFVRLDGISHWIVEEVPDTAVALVRRGLSEYSAH